MRSKQSAVKASTCTSHIALPFVILRLVLRVHEWPVVKPVTLPSSQPLQGGAEAIRS